ncbi:MAG: hypothetical protein JKY51_01810 [Opitutaceae bacterium]|nr:hypothetical protein [Opitutaceae bacterium]
MMKETVTANKVSSKGKTQAKRNMKPFIIGGVALLAAGAGYGIYYFFFKDKEDEDDSNGDAGTARKSTSIYTSKSYPLSYGTDHPDVGVLQLYLKKTYQANLGNYGKNKDGIDSKFGNATKDAALKHLKKISFTEKDIAGMKSALKFIRV